MLAVLRSAKKRGTAGDDDADYARRFQEPYFVNALIAAGRRRDDFGRRAAYFYCLWMSEGVGGPYGEYRDAAFLLKAMRHNMHSTARPNDLLEPSEI